MSAESLENAAQWRSEAGKYTQQGGVVEVCCDGAYLVPCLVDGVWRWVLERVAFAGTVSYQTGRCL